LAPDLEAQNVDLLFGAGPLTRALYDAAPAALRGAHAARAEDLREALLGALRAGDVVMIKGSNGSRMGPLAAALRETFAPTTSGSGL
jgi:UDP-N-acetylmuramoyl-tripeptide--D-alanyl-D-alanine ligase